MKRFVVLSVFLLMFVSACASSTFDSSGDKEPSTDENIVTEEVLYHKSSGTNGYFVRPAEEGVYPALILIHEWWGLNDNIRETAQRFAEEGYVALAIDMYEGELTTDPAQARVLATAVREDMDGAFDHLKAAVAYLSDQPFVDSARLASVGWCFGGGWSYEMAKNNLGVSASVIYYGRFNPEDDLEQMKAKILGHFGEDDASIAVSDVKQFQAKLKTLSGDHQIFIYPNAGHAFANEDNEAAYVEEAAEEAWKRTVEYLGEHL